MKQNYIWANDTILTYGYHQPPPPPPNILTTLSFLEPLEILKYETELYIGKRYHFHLWLP